MCAGLKLAKGAGDGRLVPPSQLETQRWVCVSDSPQLGRVRTADDTLHVVLGAACVQSRRAPRPQAAAVCCLLISNHARRPAVRFGSRAGCGWTLGGRRGWFIDGSYIIDLSATEKSLLLFALRVERPYGLKYGKHTLNVALAGALERSPAWLVLRVTRARGARPWRAASLPLP